MPLGAKFIDKFKVFLEKPRNQGKIFIFLGIIALGFGAWQIVNTIRSPFIIKNENNAIAQQVETSVKDQLVNINELRVKDTDSDGLSDYDELYVYGTSPYIEDTDSDGYTDKIEIISGNDPNCKAGEKCLLDDSTTTVAGNKANAGEPVAPPDPYTMTPEEIRSLLLEVGIDKATLDQVDDDTLRQMFIQAYTEAQQTAGQPVNTETTVPTTGSQNYTPAELRQMLLQAGVSQEKIDAVSDDELVQLYQEIISTK